MKTEVKQPETIRDAIVFVSRANIRLLLRQELKALGIKDLHMAESEKDCASLLKKYPSALFILDFETGAPIVNNVLRQATATPRIDTRPIFLFSVEPEREVIAIASEYGVSRYHTGEVSKASLAKHIKAIFSEEQGIESLRIHFRAVSELRKKGEWDAARTKLEDLAKAYPEDIRISCELAANYMDAQEWELAETTLDRLAAAPTTNVRAMHLLARCFMHQRQYDQARTVLEQTQLLNPHNLERLLELGKILLIQDKAQAALETFDQALVMEPHNREALIGKGQSLLQTGEINDALIFLKHMAGPRELAAAFNNAGVLCTNRERFDEAIQLYHTAMGAIGTIDPIRARLIFNLGLAYAKQEKFNEALSCFEKAVTADQSFAKAAHNARILKGLLASSPNPALSPVHVDLDDAEEDFADEALVVAS